MYKSVRSETSFKLYIVAAIFLFIQGALVFMFMDNPTVGALTMVIGGTFIVGAAMAKIGFGIAQRTERSIGGGYVVSSVETADAVICGCMTGFAVIALIAMQLVQIMNAGLYDRVGIVIPGIIGGFAAMAAGVVALRQSMKQGAFDQPARPVIPDDAKTCPYCNKPGISPHATSCPNCGQPLY